MKTCPDCHQPLRFTAPWSAACDCQCWYFAEKDPMNERYETAQIDLFTTPKEQEK